MIPILCDNDISFCYFFALGSGGGPHFCVKLKMCGHQFHIFAHVVPKIWKCSHMGLSLEIMPITSYNYIFVIEYDFLMEK